jgi:hypothetical protein
MTPQELRAMKKAIQRYHNYGLDYYRSVMWHEVGHAIAFAAGGRKARIEINSIGMGRCVPEGEDGDYLNELFAAACGTAAQMIYLRRNGNQQFWNVPKFLHDYLVYPNEKDRQRFKSRNRGWDISLKNFLAYSERLANKIEQLAGALDVIERVSAVPGNLPTEDIQNACSAVSGELAKLRDYARRSVRGHKRIG